MKSSTCNAENIKIKSIGNWPAYRAERNYPQKTNYYYAPQAKILRSLIPNNADFLGD